MHNLALLYETEFKDLQKAEQFYLKAAEKDHVGAMNNLAWFYFEQKKNKEKALDLAKKSYQKEKNVVLAHTYSIILTWQELFEDSMKIAQEFLSTEDFIDDFPQGATLFFLLLLAKKQYYLVLKIFNENPFKLKDRFKPVYYALMYFLQKDYPNEYRKMGGELKETVKEIIEKIAQLATDYD